MTATTERDVAEWLTARAASGYIHHLGDGQYQLPDERTEALASSMSPAGGLGWFEA